MSRHRRKRARGRKGQGRVDRARARPGPRKKRRAEPAPPPDIGDAAIEAGSAIGGAAIQAGGAIGGAVVQGGTAVGGAVVQGSLKLGSAVVRRSAHAGANLARRARAIARRMLGRTLRARARLAVPAAGLLLLLGLFACVHERPPATHRPAAPLKTHDRLVEPLVRVLLGGQSDELKLTLAGEGWSLQRGAIGAPVPLSAGVVTIRPQEGGLAVAGGANVFVPAASIRFVPGGSGDPSLTFGLGTRTYRGELEVRRLDNGRQVAIDHVRLEDYVSQVVSYEMPLRWSDAAVEAQAIAARTYALDTLRAHKPEALWDVFDDERSQVFRGVPEKPADDERSRLVVERTRGRVVTWNGEVITTYFHSTCGGDTIPAPWVFSWELEEKAPLTGATGCPCQASKFHRWSETRDLATQVKELVLELPLRELTVEHHPRGLYVKSVRIVDAGGDVEVLSGQDGRRAFGLRSPAWDAKLSADGRSATFEGRGWGHGVGMCQYGAEGQARRGLDAIAILEHYYPGARVETRY